MQQKLNGFCSHGNPAIDCIHCKEDKYFAGKYQHKTKKELKFKLQQYKARIRSIKEYVDMVNMTGTDEILLEISERLSKITDKE